jgi:4-hydroxybenzoate polyprenyltransferase
VIIALHFAWQIAFLRPNDQADCLAKFRANMQVGLLLTVAIVAANLS